MAGLYPEEFDLCLDARVFDILQDLINVDEIIVISELHGMLKRRWRVR